MAVERNDSLAAEPSVLFPGIDPVVVSEFGERINAVLKDPDIPSSEKHRLTHEIWHEPKFSELVSRFTDPEDFRDGDDT